MAGLVADQAPARASPPRTPARAPTAARAA